ncbi:MAG: type I-U CRISPR-associated protein Csb2 [Rhodovarius sp.]|nr:type I-U CRISPR-associated protein Csb2 [Rhodovarius sp.]
MSRWLCLTLRFHEGRYHGAGDWPPSPARLYQALVAAAARGGKLPEESAAALRRMEAWPPPLIAAPPVRTGQGVTFFVPNNDLDTKGGDPAKISELRTGKTQRPWLFDAALPFLYLWQLEEEDPDPACLPALAERLYQLGRGIDMAFARAEWLSDEEAEQRLAAHAGPIFRPARRGGAGRMLPCPTERTLDSLLRRHAAQAERFQGTGQGRKGGLLFIQPPKPRFRQVAYDCPPVRRVFAIRREEDFAAWPLGNVVALIEQIRNAAAERLVAAGHPDPAMIERLLIGRGATAADLPLRPRLLPLPSIGATHADHAIRRVLLEVPPDCPLRADDLFWALSGLAVGAARLVPAEAEDRMLGHYMPQGGARCWRSVTPLALPRPEPGARPARSEREETAARAVLRALRQAGITEAPTTLRLQREPFTARGRKAAEFAHPPRFPALRLMHAELRFARPLAGPLLLGDGRFLGLGLFAPLPESPDLLAFAIREGLRRPAAEAMARALRRAVMARVQAKLGERSELPAFFSGHAEDGGPLREGDHRHLAFTCDPDRGLLLIIAPHRLEGRALRAEERRQLALLDAAMADFAELRAGPAGLLRLAPLMLDEGDALLAPQRVWESVTAYRPTRHAKRASAAEALAAAVRSECRGRSWPEPEVEVLTLTEGPRGGLSARLRLRFPVARTGPILLGRTAHLGGGLFRGFG